MKTCILVANADEANHIRPILQETQNVRIIIVGEGRSHVIASLSNGLKEGIFEVGDQIINVGYVGANGYKKGNILTVGSVRHLLPSKTISEPVINLKNINFDRELANCYTADNFVNKGDIDIKNTCIVDMELYYIALMFPEVISIKIVSDELNFNDYQAADFEDSWQKVRETIKKII